MEDQAIESKPVRPPWTYLVVKWYAYVMAFFFLLYGGVSIILGILDRDYSNTNQLFLFFLFGIILITVAIGFRDRKVWGWYGLIGLNGLIILLGLLHLTDGYYLFYVVLSVGAIGLLFTRAIKGEIF